MTQAFRDEIRRVTDRPVRLLINTHHHVDHTMGNALFPEATILSHANSRSEQQRVGKGVLEWLRPNIPDLVAETDPLPVRLPDLTYQGEMSLSFEDRAIQLLHLGPAHTIGDTLVALPDDRLLFAGDIAFFYVTPLGLEGHIGNWTSVCDAVDAMPIERIVPGHGPVAGKPELRETREYLSLTHTQARAAFDAGHDVRAAVASIDLGAYASWPESAERLPLNVQRLYQEFRSLSS
jgi:glyoxylase-like metal-dependent hydrolase (beta-lactamase superfamily II)